MVVTTVTTIKAKTAFPTKTSLAMNFAKTPAFITPTTSVKPSPVQLQAIVNPLTKVSLPGTTIPATKTVVPLSMGSIVDVVAKATGVKMTSATATPKIVSSITPTYTEAQKKAFTTATNVKLGQWYLKTSPTLLPTIAMLKTKSTLSAISRAGYEVNVAGTSRQLTEFTGVINTQTGAYEELFSKYLRETGEQAKYISELSGTIETLKKGTISSAITQAQLEETLKAYLAELTKPPETTGMDWKSLILYGALAISGILILGYLLKRGK